MKHIYFDHSYTVDQHHKFLKKLEGLGFRKEERHTEHPGGLICRFLMFSAESKTKRSYLEFVHTKPKGEKLKVPGLSFGWNGNLEKFHDEMVRTRKIKTEFVHKNYDWKKDDKTRLPGWNFVNFKNTGIRSFYPWITEYEPHPLRKPRKIKSHPNGVNKIIGFEFDMNPAGEKLFKIVCGKKRSNFLTLPCGTKFYFTPAPTTKLRSVILRSKNLKQFLKKYGADKEIEFQGNPAGLIKNPNERMWNIIII